MDFPLEVSVAETSHASARESFAGIQPELIQGGKVKSYNFGPGVEYVEVFLATQKRDMKAYIEILQGPNDDNEIIEVDCKDGYDHPFYTIIQTGGGANTLRIINQNSLEFPFDAYVRPSNGGVSVSDGSAGKGPGPYF